MKGLRRCEKHTHWSIFNKWTETKRTAERGFNDRLARSGVWWAGTPGEFGANNLSLSMSPSPGSSLAEYYRVHILPWKLPKPVISFLYICLNFIGRFKKTQIGIARPLSIPPPPLSAQAASTTWPFVNTLLLKCLNILVGINHI